MIHAGARIGVLEDRPLGLGEVVAKGGRCCETEV